jgi:sporulation protein YqfC
VRRLRSGIAKVLALPEDALVDVARLTWISNTQLHVENHRGLRRFQASHIILSTLDGELEIQGKQLAISSMNRDELFVTGQIEACRYRKDAKGRAT